MTSVPAYVAALAVVVPAVAGLGGYWLAGRNDEARDKRAEARETNARRAARAERLADQRHDFQRDLLLEMQEALLRVVRSTAKIVMQDQHTLKERGQMFQMPDGMSEEAYDAGVALSRAKVRVLDDGLRGELEAFQKMVSGIAVGTVALKDASPERALAELKAELGRLTDRYAAVNETLGVLLRKELSREPEA